MSGYYDFPVIQRITHIQNFSFPPLSYISTLFKRFVSWPNSDKFYNENFSPKISSLRPIFFEISAENEFKTEFGS